MEVRMKCRGCVCALLTEKSRATNYIICVFEGSPSAPTFDPVAADAVIHLHMFASGKVVKMESCRRRYHSASNHSIRLTTCLVFCGVSEVEGETPSKHQVSQSAPMNGQWPSINLPCQLVSRPGTNYNVHLKAIWSLQLTHSSAWPHLQSGPVSWREQSWIQGRGWVQNIEFEGNQWPAVQNIARSTVGERWSLSRYHGGSFISLMDCLSVSPEQTCIWVAGGKFRGVLFSGAVAQACTSPSASWPRRVIRT